MRIKYFIHCYLLFCVIFISCNKPHKKINIIKTTIDTVIVDCNYTFEQAIKGSKAPKSIINQLTLINVKYYSMDSKIHLGQILTNKLIENDIIAIFEYILLHKFPVAQAIPIVKYNWNDILSMQANNTYSFCYRNIGYSKHAKGMAIDINPYLNPNRWKKEYSYKIDRPEGAVYNPDIPGTFHNNCKIVAKFKELGFFWGRNFSRNYDDHHFEKK